MGTSASATRRNSASGFTLIELVVAVTLFALASGMAAIVTTSTMTAVRADSQARRLVALVRLGRELAITTRRDHRIEFDVAANSVTLLRRDAGVETVVETLMFEDGMRLLQFPNLGDTPDGYGAGGVVDFGQASELIFDPDGAFIDETGLPLNGTVFLAIPRQIPTARAVTITGTTGRARLFGWSGPVDSGTWVSR